MVRKLYVADQRIVIRFVTQSQWLRAVQERGLSDRLTLGVVCVTLDS